MTVRHGIADATNDAYGPNNQNPDSDDIIGCWQINNPDWLDNEGMPCDETVLLAIQATARSLHRGGVNVIRCDGSIDFISDSVDLKLWFNMHHRDAGIGAGDESW